MIDPQLKQKLMVEARERYLVGENTIQIARSFSLSGETIRTQLKQQGVTRRNIADRNRKFQYCQTAFKQLTPNTAYFAGLLMADGNITNGKKLIQIGLKSEDSYILHEMKNHIGFSGQVGIRTRVHKSGKITEFAELRITAPELVQDLIEIQGVVPRKSKILDVHVGNAVFENGLESFFFRGVFDGDGCVHIRRNGHQYLSLAGHPNVIDVFRDWCWKKIREVGNLNRRSSVTHVVQFGSNVAVKVAKLLYIDDGGPRLWRKQNLIL